MKNKKNKVSSNMKLAFVLNLSFTILEIVGGILTNSISIMSDAIHDLGDSLSIGISLILEKISKNKPNKIYTFGYLRYSILGALINLIVLSIGSAFIIINCIPRLFNPQIVNYNGMFLLAIVGLIVNGIGAFKTSKTNNLSEKVISLHLLEDVLGWFMVLVVSLFIKFFSFYFLDPVLSLVIGIFIIINVVKNLKKVLDIILEKAPSNIDVDNIKVALLKNDSIKDVHHIHLWTLDGITNYLTAHVVVKDGISNTKFMNLKDKLRHDLFDLEVHHPTLEFEYSNEECELETCKVDMNVDLDQSHNH